MSRPAATRRPSSLTRAIRSTPTLLRRRMRLVPWLYALAWVLAFTQTLGLVHGVVHLPGAPASHAAVSLDGAGEASDPGASQETAEAKTWFALFGHHAGAACHAYDHLSHGDAMASGGPAFAAHAAPTFVAGSAATPPIAAAPSPFQARGPPSFG